LEEFFDRFHLPLLCDDSDHRLNPEAEGQRPEPLSSSNHPRLRSL
jgi:hypothetical protein